jgi:fructose-1,6-bisphosphatase/inositol monophosphatase family enzyme
MHLDLEQATRTARELVREQAAVVLERWGDVGALTYKNRRDFLSAVDLDVERNLVRGLSQRFPGHGTWGEETGRSNEDSDYQWLIDPIDGTKYYVAQSSLFSISVGLLRDGEPVVGVVHLAASGQCFHAYAGGGAYLDDRKLACRAVDRLSDAIVNLDTPNSSDLSDAERAWFERKLIAIQRASYRVRALGVGSLAACWLASGAFDAYLDLTGYHIPQDLAAGRVLMREAGARVDFVKIDRAGPPRLLAAPGGVWKEMEQLLHD